MNNFQPWLPIYTSQPRTYHLFISHSWDYGVDRNGLVDLIAGQVGPFYDYAATQDDPIHSFSDTDLAQAIANRVAQARVFIIPAGMYAGHSKWIPIEIQIALEMRKPIIGVEKWGAQRSSAIVTNNASEIVGWNGVSIAGAIRRWHD
jgi:hypothetical protein